GSGPRRDDDVAQVFRVYRYQTGCPEPRQGRITRPSPALGVLGIGPSWDEREKDNGRWCRKRAEVLLQPLHRVSLRILVPRPRDRHAWRVGLSTTLPLRVDRLEGILPEPSVDVLRADEVIFERRRAMRASHRSVEPGHNQDASDSRD